jgi:hypothetical protein
MFDFIIGLISGVLLTTCISCMLARNVKQRFIRRYSVTYPPNEVEAVHPTTQTHLRTNL